MTRPSVYQPTLVELRLSTVAQHQADTRRYPGGLRPIVRSDGTFVSRNALRHAGGNMFMSFWEAHSGLEESEIDFQNEELFKEHCNWYLSYLWGKWMFEGRHPHGILKKKHHVSWTIVRKMFIEAGYEDDLIDLPRYCGLHNG